MDSETKKKVIDYVNVFLSKSSYHQLNDFYTVQQLTVELEQEIGLPVSFTCVDGEDCFIMVTGYYGGSVLGNYSVVLDWDFFTHFEDSEKFIQALDEVVAEFYRIQKLLLSIKK